MNETGLTQTKETKMTEAQFTLKCEQKATLNELKTQAKRLDCAIKYGDDLEVELAEERLVEVNEFIKELELELGNF